MRLMSTLAAAAMLATGTGSLGAVAGEAQVQAQARSAAAQVDRDSHDRQMQRSVMKVRRRMLDEAPDIDLRPLRLADPMPRHKSPGTRAKARWKKARRSSRQKGA